MKSISFICLVVLVLAPCSLMFVDGALLLNIVGFLWFGLLLSRMSEAHERKKENP